MKKTIVLLSILAIWGINLLAAPINIPLGANAYLTQNAEGAKIKDNGIINWGGEKTVISSWFHINETGTINLSLRAKSFAADTQIRVTVANKSYDLTLHSKEWTVYPIADNIACEKGHLRIDIVGVKKTTNFYADLSDLVVDGSALTVAPNYVKDFSYHFGRRGPSVHLGYKFPENEDIEYFYNEVTVPVGEDIVGSYYMSNGFEGGYFGMQANSDKERRVLFSVWSPFTTDNPNDIPKEDRIVKLRRGEEVHIGEFGNEGSGGQSFLKYNWKAGVTYKFLQQVKPDGKGNTIFTAYFFATDENKWRLIASFKRPKTDSWYKRPHSFLENFIPNQGYLSRKVLFSNQWAVTKSGEWFELTESKFSNDATARAGKRVDCKGGLDGNNFFLENGGFSDTKTEFGSIFNRTKENKKPTINFNQLAEIK